MKPVCTVVNRADPITPSLGEIAWRVCRKQRIGWFLGMIEPLTQDPGPHTLSRRRQGLVGRKTDRQ